MFHHIDHEQHVSLLEELRRVLQPDGCSFVFEHNPYNPLTVRAVNSCVFDENAKFIKESDMKGRMAVAGFEGALVNFRVFSNYAFRFLRPIERAVAGLLLGDQYYSMAHK